MLIRNTGSPETSSGQAVQHGFHCSPYGRNEILAVSAWASFHLIVRISKPQIISAPPNTIFQVSCSFKKNIANKMVIRILALSMSEISETLPILIAL